MAIYFYSVFWVRALWAKVSKQEILDTHQKREKERLITEKLLFSIFAVFCLLVLFFFFFVVLCFFVFSWP